LVDPDSVRTEYARDELNRREPVTLGDALRRAGCDVARGVFTLPENAPVPEHFEKAVELGRVFATNRWVEAAVSLERSPASGAL
jgi:hypothetical protein